MRRLLTDVKTNLNDPAILELLDYASAGDAEPLESTLDAYRSRAEWKLYGFEEEGEWIGLVGFSLQDGRLELKHLCVHPESQGLGYGRGQLLELIEQFGPSEIVAETDEAGAGFFRGIGFEVVSLGEKTPGVERFQCRYVVDQEEE
ncbi:GNAT family N-acetyltransferase [Paenibacillus ginsengihumi]|uniref:GNAT family N-acetyltransferase n=1 Tax=Paenibacillus ginsengihumi TaxID=431596 RepID=UPI001FDED311|nr:GNAT family N-acetyltransferase [Paenibacillus ginsengihumi]